MLLGKTASLGMAGGKSTLLSSAGYLESQPGSERKRRGSRSVATLKADLMQALTSAELKEMPDAPRTPEKTEGADAPFSPPDASPEEKSALEWTVEPARMVRNDGKVVVKESVAKPKQGPRKHALHLERTVRIEPRPGSSASSRKPPLPRTASAGKKVEQIVVTEADLKRAGGDMKRLRECQLKVPPRRTPEPAEEGEKGIDDMDLSFKSKFALKCRLEADVRDPWKNIENPEKNRELGELDHVGLNQPWIKPDSPPRKGISEALLASPPFGWSKEALLAAAANPDDDEVPTWHIRARSADPAELLARHHRDPLGISNRSRQREGSATRQRSSSVYGSVAQLPRGVADPGAVGRQTVSGAGRSGRRWRSNSSSGYDQPLHREERSSRRRSGSRPSLPSTPPPLPSVDNSPSPPRPIVSRIQVLDDSELGPSLDDNSGSLAVRLGTRAQRANIRVLSEGSMNGQSRVAWLALDITSGEVVAYPGDAAHRLESAHRSGRRTVPLAGLSDSGLEGSIMHFGTEKSEGGVEKHLSGRERLALRVQVGLLYNAGDVAAEAVVHVEHTSDSWQFAPHGEGKERRIGLSPTELVTPPSPTAGPGLPPVHARGQIYFMNPGAMQ